MIPTLASKVTISSDAILREVEGESVLVDLRSESYFGLNEMGTRIWRLIEENGTLQTVFDSLLEEYDVEPDRLERDLSGIVAELAEAGLLVIDG